MYEDSEDKDQRGEVALKSNARETPIRENKREDTNALLEDGYEVDDDILPATKNKPIPTGDTYRPVYKEGYKWSVIDHRRESGCRGDAMKLDGMNK